MTSQIIQRVAVKLHLRFSGFALFQSTLQSLLLLQDHPVLFGMAVLQPIRLPHLGKVLITVAPSVKRGIAVVDQDAIGKVLRLSRDF